jgi:hypothetical protein
MVNVGRIGVIIPYFGRLPKLSQWYFHSCAQNPEIDFLIFTDQNLNFELPSNVIHFPFSRDEFNRLASKKSGIKIKLRNPYKLCDFKPLYGHFFEDYLEEYHFWGYTDLDMILGKVSSFISFKLLMENDIITARRDSFAGNFTLFKNNHQLAQLYKASTNWRTIMQTPDYYFGFDEHFIEKGKYIGFSSVINRVVKRFNKPNVLPGNNDLNSIALKYPELKIHYGNFILSDEYFLQRGIKEWEVNLIGGVFIEKHSRKEALYFHFYRAKSHKDFIIPKVIDFSKTQNISITPAGIFLNDQDSKL